MCYIIVFACQNKPTCSLIRGKWKKQSKVIRLFLHLLPFLFFLLGYFYLSRITTGNASGPATLLPRNVDRLESRLGKFDFSWAIKKTVSSQYGVPCHIAEAHPINDDDRTLPKDTIF